MSQEIRHNLTSTSSLSSQMSSSTRPIVFMDVNIGETPAGRLKMELFSDIVPKYKVSFYNSFTFLRLKLKKDGRKLSTIVYGRIPVCVRPCIIRDLNTILIYMNS